MVRSNKAKYLPNKKEPHIDRGGSLFINAKKLIDHVMRRSLSSILSFGKQEKL